MGSVAEFVGKWRKVGLGDEEILVRLLGSNMERAGK
jgi:hypothetical protein